MKITTHFGRKHRLSTALLASTLLAAGGTASAAPSSLTLQYTCPLPLIGNQPVVAEITADVPAEITVGTPSPEFAVTADATVNDDSRTGLKLVGSETIEGTATSTTVVSAAGGDETVTVDLAIPQTTIPDTTGSFVIPASGTAPALSFTADDVGEGTITVGALTLDMTARTADGAVAPAPIGQFTSDCTLDAGQDNTLATFQVVSGDTTAPANISVDPEAVDFGSVQAGLTKDSSVTIANTGGATLGINGVSLGGANADAFMQTNDCATVAGGESCTVNLTYYASGEGAQTAELTIQSGDEDTPTVTVPLTGTSTAVLTGEITVDPAQVQFGTVSVGASAEQTVTLTNTGLAGLTISSLDISGANSGDYMQTSDCSTVAKDASCSITVTYTASAAGASSATLTIESDDADNAPVDVQLSAQGDDGSSNTIPFLLDINGDTQIAASGSSLPLTGTIDADLELATGMFNADLSIDPTSGSFPILKGLSHLKAYAQVEFEQVEQTTGTLQNGVLTSKSTLYVKVPMVYAKIFGFKLPLGGGSECKTMDPVTINMQTPDGESFQPASGGNLTGSYTLPPLQHCGALTDILNLYLAGPSNSIDLALTPSQGSGSGDAGSGDDTASTDQPDEHHYGNHHHRWW